MDWICYLSHFMGGVFLTNSIPHIVSGITGRLFQSPFAKPSGQGLSSPIVNVVWGFFNVVLGYLLIIHVGHFDLHSIFDSLCVGSGSFLIALFSAYHFGKFNGRTNLKS